MRSRGYQGRAWLAAVAAGLLGALAPGLAGAGVTGKLAGRVLDAKKQPVEAATVVLVGTRLGAYTGADGRYQILNIPSGTYTVSFSRLGFAGQRIQNVVVSADQTTTLDAALRETEVTAEEVVVTAERPPVEIGTTSTSTTLTTEQIESLPVQNLEDVVNLQAGVVEGHFRGGRLGEVQFQVDGVSVNNAFSNKPMLNLDRSLLQEVQVISGTFDAEYGQAMSGVVNAVLKQGTEDLRWNGEVYGGGFLYLDTNERWQESDPIDDSAFRPAGVQSYQLTVSGPLPAPDTVFLLSGRRFAFDDFVYGVRYFVPTDSSALSLGQLRGTGDRQRVPLDYVREWSGVAKLTNSSFPNHKLNYQATFSRREGRNGNFAFRYNPDGQTKYEEFTIAHGPDWTWTLGAQTFLNLSLRQNYVDYQDMAFDSVWDPRYDAAGPAEGIASFERGVYVEGVSFGRYMQRTNAFVAKGSLASQVSPEHLVKFGGELELPEVTFGTPGHLTEQSDPVTGEVVLTRRIDESPDYPGPATYHPMMAAAFVQDQYESDNLTVRAGLRFDFMDARATVPSDLANPANALADQPQSVPVSTTKKTALSPRLGVAYPIEDKAAVHFAYGHFRQFPPVGEIFNNADYNVLYNLQSGIIPAALGNPDVRPEKTVQYEIGYKHAVSADLGVDLTVFYKDIRDLLGVEFIDTYNDAEYARLTNIDFGDVLGITLALDHRRLGPFSVSLDYTWQQAMGNSSDPRETQVRASAGQDPRPRLIPFNWDQRHTLNLTAALERPDDYNVSAILRVCSGQPYTPALDVTTGFGLNDNAGRKPSGALLDLRAEKRVKGIAPEFAVFMRVFNLFDSRYYNGFVFDSTGSPDYTLDPVGQYGTLRDPGRYYQPRRLEIGARFGLGAP